MVRGRERGLVELLCPVSDLPCERNCEESPENPGLAGLCERLGFAPMAKSPPEKGLHLQWFAAYDEAVDHIDEYTAFLKRDPRLKWAGLIVSRPRPEASGYALYAIPRPAASKQKRKGT